MRTMPRTGWRSLNCSVCSAWPRLSSPSIKCASVKHHHSDAKVTSPFDLRFSTYYIKEVACTLIFCYHFFPHSIFPTVVSIHGERGRQTTTLMDSACYAIIIDP
jgi:hypothetical protein